MFDFGNANEGQRLAISTADGPVLITAGPGTGNLHSGSASYLLDTRMWRCSGADNDGYFYREGS